MREINLVAFLEDEGTEPSVLALVVLYVMLRLGGHARVGPHDPVH